MKVKSLNWLEMSVDRMRIVIRHVVFRNFSPL